MKRFFAGVSFFLLLSFYPFYAHAVVHRLGLIIGNNEGTNGLATLRYAEQDARNIYRTLLDIGQIPEAHLKLLVGSNPLGLAKAIRELDAISKKLLKDKKNDVLLFVFYSGHSESGQLEMGPHHVSYFDFLEHIRSIPSTLRLITLDACESGNLIMQKGVRSKGGAIIPSFTNFQTELNIPQGEVLITSSTAVEESLETDDIKGSIFSHYLNSGLRGDADFNLDGIVTLSEINSYVSDKTIQKAKTHARSQHPSFHYQLTGTGEIPMTYLSNGSPLLMLQEDDFGHYVILTQKERTVIAEVEKIGGSRKWLSLPVGDLVIQKKEDAYFLEEAIRAERGQLYRFETNKSRRVSLSPARYMNSPTIPSMPRASKTLQEGDVLRLRLLEEVNSERNHQGDIISLEASEDVFVDGALVIPAGSPSTAEISSLHTKKGFQHGEMSLKIGYVKAIDGQWIPLRSVIIKNAGRISQTSPVEDDSGRKPDILTKVTQLILLPFYPLVRGKEASIEAGTLFEAYVARTVEVH